MSQSRLDKTLVSAGMAADAEEAALLIESHRVSLNGSVDLKPSTLVPKGANLMLESVTRPSSRAGAKLEGALDTFSVTPKSKACLDVGSGSGGFTECLIEQGASSVTAVDVGYGIIDAKLRTDPRVRLLERTNIRHVSQAELGGPFDLVVADLSFISLTTVLPKVVSVAKTEGDLVLLVKPQFEAPRPSVPKGGVVRNPQVWEEALERVCTALSELNWGVGGVATSRVKGRKGNQEFFVWARRDIVAGTHAHSIESAVKSAV